IYGVSIAAISMLATVGITISIDTYCPIINDAKVIAKMSDYNPEAHEIIEHLHKLGQNTLLMRKDLAISSAFMTAIVVFMAFAISANISPISFYEPYLIFGLIIGVCFPTLLSSLSVNSINRISTKILEEAKKQFKEYQVLDKNADSVSTDSKAVITVSALAVIRAIVVPVICLITIPLLIYSMFGKEALAGMCLGTFITGTILSLFIVNTAEVWSSANNFFQSDKLVVKDYDESLDTSLFLSNSVGNYLKDSSGLLMSLLIKFIAIYALILSFSF
nr:sodium/proton-translocating pyrophosphatase [Pseudomonadota bacterium]